MQICWNANMLKFFAESTKTINKKMWVAFAGREYQMMDMIFFL